MMFVARLCRCGPQVRFAQTPTTVRPQGLHPNFVQSDPNGTLGRAQKRPLPFSDYPSWAAARERSACTCLLLGAMMWSARLTTSPPEGLEFAGSAWDLSLFLTHDRPLDRGRQRLPRTQRRRPKHIPRFRGDERSGRITITITRLRLSATQVAAEEGQHRQGLQGLLRGGPRRVRRDSWREAPTTFAGKALQACIRRRSQGVPC